MNKYDGPHKCFLRFKTDEERFDVHVDSYDYGFDLKDKYTKEMHIWNTTAAVPSRCYVCLTMCKQEYDLGTRVYASLTTSSEEDKVGKTVTVDVRFKDAGKTEVICQATDMTFDHVNEFELADGECVIGEMGYDISDALYMTNMKDTWEEKYEQDGNNED